MKASEIQIGDWVKTTRPYGSTKKKIFKVRYLHRDCEIENGEFQTFRPFDEIKPIPLTQKILELNGFERSYEISDSEPFDLDEDGNAYYQVGEFGLDIPHLWGWYKDNTLTLPSNCTKWLNIHYVHELQHILRICGLNELADNFKIEK